MKNYVQEGKSLTVAAPVAVAAGDPFVVGKLPLVADAAAAQAANVQGKRDGVFTHTVYGHDGTNPAAVAIGDKVYCDNAAAVADRLTVHTADVEYGIALGAVGAGEKTAIPVLVP